MECKLSPSSLNLLEDCPRCFWLNMVKKIYRPYGPMSSIPIIDGKVTGWLAVEMPKEREAGTIEKVFNECLEFLDDMEKSEERII